MKYILTPGNIAAVLHVECGDSEPQTLCYMAPDKMPATVLRPGYNESAFFESLPLPVRAAINKHFGIVFSLPVDRRGHYMANCQALTIDVSDVEGSA